MRGREKQCYLPCGKTGILKRDELRSKIGNYMDFHTSKLARLFVHYPYAFYAHICHSSQSISRKALPALISRVLLHDSAATLEI
jgi:hypothetical protein